MIVRPSRPLHSQPRFLSRSRHAALVAASVASVLLGTFVSSEAIAQASSASAASVASEASAPAAASAAATTVTQYSVKPGQSLSDIASQITGSNDRATREKMARALFDANPNAFMGHDPSRLKLGSVLNVPVVEGLGVAGAASGTSAPVAASSPAVEASGSVGAAAPAEGASNAVGAASAAATATSGAVATVAPNASSEALPTSEAQPAASASEAVSASEVVPASAAAPALSAPAATVAPVSAPSATGSTAMSLNGPIGWLVGAVVVIGLLLLVMRSGKRRRAASAAAVVTTDERVQQEPPTASKQPETAVVPPHDESANQAQAPTGAADLDGASVQRGQSELNVVAASMENYDAAQSFDTPTEDKPFPPAKSNPIDDDADGARVTLGENRAQDAAGPVLRDAGAKRAPFMPDAPAALHRDFTPPRPGAIEAALAAERAAAGRAEALRIEMEAREHELREAAALEQATREAVAQEAAARELEAQEVAAREAEAREAEAREAEAREAEAREAEAREAEAREAEAREAEAREAEAREAAAHAASAHESGEQAASTESVTDESAVNQQNDTEESSAYDDEPSPASRFPQPKFPQEAIEALSALDFGLPPRQEAPHIASEAHVQPLAPVAPAVTAAQNEAPLAPAPATPQPIADPAVFDRQNEQRSHPEPTAPPPSASEEIESGTAGAASVAGLGASRFGPLSLDFDYNSPASQTAPLPAFTPEQISTIARNKLELAVEYIELGDLSGARTLLQEVIESNDPATRQSAAALLSTLAPLS
ncbi:transmembrane protein [Caballeronia udeis]|uniref:Transmembrane protein n=1 Tax=Caballeronia udeis TaxID=1232866 RepID=A0A158GTT3_9BURK|nr:FimV/HubP family polar landmark protein [Caballeronia udeis]SAL35211.1 transmembrane protein [Caballeronia udeis]